MNRPLQSLFDSTHCLSKRQLRDYASGLISREEAYAVESHLNTCALCSAAVDGMIAHLPESAGVFAEVNGDFLKEHFRKNSPQIHLNTLAPAAASLSRSRPSRTQPIWRMAGIAAALLLAVGSFWWLNQRGEENMNVALAPANNGPVAQAFPSRESAEGEAIDRAAPGDAAAESDSKPLSANPAAYGREVRADSVTTSGLAYAQKADVHAFEAQTQANASLEDAPAPKADRTPRPSAAAPATRRESPTVASTRSAADKETKQADAATSEAGAGSAAASAPDDASKKKAPAADALAEGKAQYSAGEYRAALQNFTRELNASSRSRRHEAMYYAAQCHSALGHTTRARRLLEQLVEDGAAQTAQARRQLQSMEEGSRSRRASRAGKP